MTSESDQNSAAYERGYMECRNRMLDERDTLTMERDEARADLELARQLLAYHGLEVQS